MSTAATDRALALPVDERGRALFKLKEDQWLDRKSSGISARDLAESLVGFANAEGGSIVLGLWNGQVEGVDRAPEGRVAQWDQAASDFTMPTVACRSRLVECVNQAGEPDHIFVIEIDTSERVHANQRDEVFLRVGDENRRGSRSVLLGRLVVGSQSRSPIPGRSGRASDSSKEGPPALRWVRW
jgi:ATP-dependent DNA helicase RecG